MAIGIKALGRHAARRTPSASLTYGAVVDILASDADALSGLAAVILASSTTRLGEPAGTAAMERLLQLPDIALLGGHKLCGDIHYALELGSRALENAGPEARVLVLGVHRQSAGRRSDQEPASIVGDGAGAVVLGAVPEPFGLRALRLGGSGEHAAFPHRGPVHFRCQLDEYLLPWEHLDALHASRVSQCGLKALADTMNAACADAGISLGDVDTLILQDATVPTLAAVAEHLQIDRERFATTTPLHGCAGAASIPVTLAQAHSQRPFIAGQYVLLAASTGPHAPSVAVFSWPEGVVPPRSPAGDSSPRQRAATPVFSRNDWSS